VAQEPEHRMLFDLRGRRKRVVQVIYVMLAFIMAASLVVIGLPGGINPFNGNGSSGASSDYAKQNIERADKIQTKLQANPDNANLAKELVRARYSAATSLTTTDASGQTTYTDDATTQLELTAEAWNKYLKAAGNNPDPEVAQLMSQQVFFTLAQGSTVAQFQSNIKDAVKAQQIVADDAVQKQKNNGPSATNQLTNLAIYQLYAQQFDAAEKTRQEALAATDDKSEKKSVNATFDQTEKDAKRVGKLIDQALKQAQKDGGKSLENPLGSLGSDTSITGASGSTTTP